MASEAECSRTQLLTSYMTNKAVKFMCLSVLICKTKIVIALTEHKALRKDLTHSDLHITIVAALTVILYFK